MSDSMDALFLRQGQLLPFWLPSGDKFWYRHEYENEKFKFIFVDASKKTQQPAFDHKALASKIQAETGCACDPESLPFSTIDLDPENHAVRFRVKGRAWQYAEDGTLVPWEEKLDNEELMEGINEEHRSPWSRDKTSIMFINHSARDLSLHWIDEDSSPVSYGKIEPNDSKLQSTFVGHVWRVSDAESNQVLAIYEAPSKDGTAIIDASTQTNEKPDPNQPTPELKEAPKDESKPPPPENTQRSRVFVRDSNLWINRQGGSERQLSTNGSKEQPYDEKKIFISPLDDFVAAWQFTPAQDHEVHLVESSPEDQLQPKLKTIQYLKPGDRVRIDRPRLFSLENLCEISTDDELFRNPYAITNEGWSKDGKEYRFIFNERGHQSLRMIAMDAQGHVRTVVEERSNTFIDYSTKLWYKLLEETNELLWASERDGWNHLFLIDLSTGSVKNQVTRGEWVVNSVERVDVKNRRIWFKGFGLIPDQDPYYAHLVHVNFDGSDLKILTGGNGTHTWNISPDDRHFVDTWSRVDCPPTSVLRSLESGDKIMDLEECSLDELQNSGWQPPEIFATPGRDDKTMIHGIIARPSSFDPKAKYPVIEDIYAGPQGFFTTKAFSTLPKHRQWANQGYVVVQLDGMGTNWRSKAFHDICYKNLKDAGFPDRIKWIKAAAETRPWMDLTRVGIRGVSAGGQNAMGALLFHGEFYKAAKADSACHDNRMDKLWWNEQWMGYPVDKSYEDCSNVVHAGKLSGALMLIVGELDTNVDPSSTMQVVNALTKADKDYELVLVPGGKHGCGEQPYGYRRQTDFFKRHLHSA